MNPNQTETYNNLGIAYNQIKNFTEAITAFKNAIRINPQFIDSYINFGVSYKEIRKENEEALKLYKEGKDKQRQGV